MLGLLAFGVFRYVTGQAPVYVPPPTTRPTPASEGVQALSLLLVLRAFASGAVGLTGTEAIADGVRRLQAPGERNARDRAGGHGRLLRRHLYRDQPPLRLAAHHPDPREVETINSQLTRTLVGIGPYYYLVQFATALLLVLAANTAFADFPRLAYFLARDKFLPGHFAFRGERLAFSSGIIILAAVAAILILLFQGSVTGLLPLYGIGVFTAFTLSQAALVARWWRRREPGWRLRLAVNAAGAATTAIVAVVVGVTRFTQGAWVVLLLIPALVALLLGIRRHFNSVTDHLTLDLSDAEEHPDRLQRQLHHSPDPRPDLNRAATRAIAYARSLTGGAAPASTSGAGSRRQHRHPGRPRHGRRRRRRSAAGDVGELRPWRAAGDHRGAVPHPDRPTCATWTPSSTATPTGTTLVTVLLPEFIPAHWWEHLLHTQTALMLKGALLFRPRTAVTSVPYHLYD